MTSLALLGSTGPRTRNATVISNRKKIHVEERCNPSAAGRAPAVIFLHGSGGPESVNLPYRDEEEDLVKLGYCSYAPHYLDATGGSAENPPDHYSAWVRVVEDTVKYITTSTGTTRNRIALVGYSLGASVALAAGATDPHFAAIVEFSGSLPDDYIRALESFPPLLIIHGRDDSFVPVENAIQLTKLCELRHFSCTEELHIGEGHFFTNAAIIRSNQKVKQFLKARLPIS